MKKILFGVAVLGLLGLAGAGIGLKAQDTVEAKADEITYYLTGSFNGWSTNPAECVPFVYNNASEVKILGQEFTGNNTFSVFTSANTTIWDNPVVESRGINVYTISQTVQGGSKTVAGIHYNNAANTFNLYFNYSLNKFYVDFAYKLTVGEKSVWMEGHNESEHAGTISGVSAGDAVSVTAFDKTGGTLNIGNKHSNNINSSKQLKVGGTVTLYLNRNNWDTWVSGYSGSGADGLQDFCDSLLRNTPDCAVPAVDSDVYEWISGDWDSVSASGKSEFLGATPNYGMGKQYSSVVVEARTRYGYLLDLGMVDFTGSLGSARNVSQYETASSDNGLATIAIVVTAATLLGAGVFFIARKRRAE